jgi:hypothetical protein
MLVIVVSLHTAPIVVEILFLIPHSAGEKKDCNEKRDTYAGFCYTAYAPKKNGWHP